MNAVNLKCLDPTIFPVTYVSTFLLAAVCVFSDLNIDGCCDNHGFPLFVLSFLGSHDSVSLCAVLLNKIRFVYDFCYNFDVSFCLNHIIFFTSVLLLVLFCQIFMPLVKFYRYICNLKCEPEYVCIKSNMAVMLFLPYHINNTKTKCLQVDCTLKWRWTKSFCRTLLLLAVYNKRVERTF